MKDKRKISVWIVISGFLIVTTAHVSFYALQFEPTASHLLSWPFALMVDGAILVFSYFTRWQLTSKSAWVGYFLCTVMSGLMNIGYVNPQTIPAWAYAIFPTLAIALLGWLFRQVDKLPTKTGKVEKPIKVPVDFSTGDSIFPVKIPVMKVYDIMEKYGVKKSRAYEIIKEEKSKLNGHNS